MFQDLKLEKNLCFLNGFLSTMKKFNIYLINFIYDIKLNFDIDEKELQMLIESLSFDEMQKKINKNFKEMISRRGEFISLTCGHNGFLNTNNTDCIKEFLKHKF